MKQVRKLPCATALIVAVLLSTLRLSCGSPNEESLRRFLVISTGAGFTGYYVQDGDTANSTTFESPVTPETGFYKSTIGLDASNTVYIYVVPITETTPTTKTLQLLLYDNTKLLKEMTATSTTSTVNGQTVTTLQPISLPYDFSTSTTTTTTTTK